MTGQNSGLFARANNNKRNNNHIASNGFSANKKAKLILSSTTIATVVAKHFKNARNIKLHKSPLHVLIDSGYQSTYVTNKNTTHYHTPL